MSDLTSLEEDLEELYLKFKGEISPSELDVEFGKVDPLKNFKGFKKGEDQEIGKLILEQMKNPEEYEDFDSDPPIEVLMGEFIQIKMTKSIYPTESDNPKTEKRARKTSTKISTSRRKTSKKS